MQRIIVAITSINTNETAEFACPVDHLLGHRIAKSRILTGLSHAEHEPTDAVLMAPRPAEHLAVQEKALAAHHPFFGDARMRSKRHAHAVVQLFIDRHQTSPPSCHKIASPSTNIVSVVSAAPIVRPLLSAAARRLK